MSGSSQQEEFLTVADVAALLKLNQQTVRNWIDQGSLPAHRIGRRVRIRRVDLDRIIDSGKTAVNVDAVPVIEGPNGDDFWGGEAVGAVDLGPHGSG